MWYLLTDYSSLSLKRSLAIVIIVPRDYKGPSRLSPGICVLLTEGHGSETKFFKSLEIETLIEGFHNHKEILNSSFTNTSTNASKQRAWASLASLSLSLSLPLSLSLSLSLGKSLNHVHVRIYIHGIFFSNIFLKYYILYLHYYI